ncbi:MAG TPA: hypothetical protein PLQ13_08295 [Candidatus Krumholzibacteria bacterium]|nr:hypothetical protein [Candidatus Krumholzibacteria bacterium]
MNSRKITATVLAVLVGAILCIPEDAAAIPAFARRYKLSCTTCHSPFPRLKEFGNEFAAAGFMIPEQENDRDYVSAGDDLLHLNRTFPVAVRFDAFTIYEEDAAVTTDLQTPFGLKLLSGGPLAKNVSYYFYFFMYETGEVAGVEDAYVHFNDIGGRPLDVMVGQFQVCDPLMKRELRLTYEDYEVYGTRIGEAVGNLTYDRGILATYDIASSGTGLVAMLVNGNGKPAAEGGKFDNDKDKNFAGRITQQIGGFARIGYFYYAGQERRAASATPDLVLKNGLHYHGPDLVAGNGTLDLTVQYLLRTDSNPMFAEGATRIETNGVVAELVISPHKDRSRTYATLLYNRLDSDLDAYDYESWTGSLTHLMARNLRGTLEYTYDAEREISRVGLGLVAAF